MDAVDPRCFRTCVAMGGVLGDPIQSQNISRRTRLVYTICTSVAGVLLVYGSLYPEYYLRSDLRIFGVPFMTTAFQFERGRWIDYTGFLTLRALLGNALAAFLLPQLFVIGAK